MTSKDSTLSRATPPGPGEEAGLGERRGDADEERSEDGAPAGVEPAERRYGSPVKQFWRDRLLGKKFGAPAAGEELSGEE